jgi:hypothetical protein
MQFLHALIRGEVVDSCIKNDEKTAYSIESPIILSEREKDTERRRYAV